METTFDEADISIYHVIFIANSIEKSFKAFANVIGKINDDDERALYVTVSSMILIHTVSFIDEYNHFLKSKNEELGEAIINIKKTVKPALKAIRRWTEINDFRNYVLAHNLRNGKEGQSVFEKGLDSFDIPKNGSDFHVLVSCISMIKEVFESAFRYKLATYQAYLDNRPPSAMANLFNGMNDVEIEIESIRKEINANILKLKQDHGTV